MSADKNYMSATTQVSADKPICQLLHKCLQTNLYVSYYTSVYRQTYMSATTQVSTDKPICQLPHMCLQINLYVSYHTSVCRQTHMSATTQVSGDKPICQLPHKCLQISASITVTCRYSWSTMSLSLTTDHSLHNNHDNIYMYMIHVSTSCLSFFMPTLAALIYYTVI